MGGRVGLFFVILFIVCFVWFYLRAGSDSEPLHNSLLALSFFGWSGMNLVSFILGLIQSFIWGYLAVALWRLSGIFFKGSDNN